VLNLPSRLSQGRHFGGSNILEMDTARFLRDIFRASTIVNVLNRVVFNFVFSG
jgi:hypothetical protein